MTPRKVTCWRCGGRGTLKARLAKAREDSCPICQGEGKVSEQRQMPDIAHGIADLDEEDAP